MPFKFRTYVSATGRTEVQCIIDKLNPVVLEFFLGRVRYLANVEKRDWSEPKAKKLQGIEGIYEIKFKANNVQYRPLGFFGPGDDKFTILVWCTHKQNIYHPPGAIKTAGERRKDIIAGQATCRSLEIDGVEFPPLEE